MRIPPKVKIGGHTYRIEFVRPTELTEDEAPSGNTNHKTRTIEINTDRHRSVQEATLFHEVFHTMNGELSEEIVEFLSESMYAFLKENGMLR